MHVGANQASSRDFVSGNAQPQPPAGFSYESYQTPASSSHSQPTATSPLSTSTARAPEPSGDGGDTSMQDASDPYGHSKYASRPQHQHQSSVSAIRASQFHEESSASRMYTPMDALSPSSPYATSSQQQAPSPYNSYSPQSQQPSRSSPTRSAQYISPSHTYFPSSSSRQQLPPLQASAGTHLSAPYSGSDARSPRQMQPHYRAQLQTSSKGQVPQFAKLKAIQELEPKINTQPAFRRANPEGGFISGSKNDGYDNEDSDYILYVNDILGSEETGHKRNRYLILDVLGQGTFGQVVKCQNLKTQEVVAVKVVKNRTAYFNQSMMEVSVLDLLNSKLDKNDDHHLLRLKDTFIHRQHLCLVFELLSVNLYELIKQNQFRGLSTTLVRVFAQQLLNGLSLLNKARLIHCDLKPENILLKNLESPIIKIIDFGSACDERQTVYTYIQSRFYRSPEVLLGLPYTSAIDMWSLGCIVVELFLGLPLFPGSSEYNQVSRITEMLSLPPTWMLEMGKQSGEFFEKVHDEFGRRTYRLKSMEQFSREHGTKEQPSKKYFQATRLEDIIRSYSMPRKNMKQAEIDKEMNNRVAFIDFVRGLLNINPLERWSPQQAKLHPFITQQKFTGPFVPPMNLKSSSINKSPAPGMQQQQQAEALSKQRAQAQQVQVQAQAQAQAQAQVQAHAQAQSAVQGAYPGMQMGQYPSNTHTQQPPPVYNSMYVPSANSLQQGAPPPYPAQPTSYGHQMGMMPQATAQMPNPQYNVPPNLYAQATTRAGRQRASTLDQQQGGIPAAIQRVASHLDPNAPIRLQPSPAYYPPPPDGAPDGSASSRRRGSRAGQGQGRSNRDFIRNLEDRTLEEGFMNQPQWH
ncbi:MAG: dual specificity protein kinase yak1 [Trizodia sp. TS-e1964]|nr:MAG: dual specificity protein kinase yak1 [Trizodia sp. TS-e1964]